MSLNLHVSLKNGPQFTLTARGLLFAGGVLY
jgi:hypothetical protein